MTKRFYQFGEFGRDIVYDTERVTAFFVNAVEKRFLTVLQEGQSLEECIRILKNQYSNDDITEAVNHITNEGIVNTPQPMHRNGNVSQYTLDLNVIQQCNLRCKYCYVKNPGSRSAMNEKTARKAVDFIAAFDNGFTISFYGGEPLLNFPVIQSTMEYASKKAEEKGLPDVHYTVTTNGTLLTDNMIDFFSRYHMNIDVSIDGPAEIHDALRVTPDGKGTHAAVMDRLHALINTKGTHTVSASGVVTKYSTLTQVYQYLSQIPLKNMNISCVRPLYNQKESIYALSDAEKMQYLKDMREVALDCLHLLLKGVRPPYYMFEKKILDLWRHARTSHFCPAGLTRFGVSPKGNVYPCGFAADREQWILGTTAGLDVRNRDSWLTHAMDEPEACLQCWARFLCVEKCPLQQVKKSRCEISQHSTRLAIALYAAVKEQNEMLFASLVDEEFLAKMRDMIQQNR